MEQQDGARLRPSFVTAGGSSLALSERHMALPEPKLHRTLRDVIIETMQAWSRDVVEQSHPAFGGLPSCPFARAARLKGTIDWEVQPFDVHARLAGIPSLADLRAFAAHPESRISAGGVLTRVSPFPSFQVLSHSLLKTASDSLQGSGYYHRFSPETLRALGLPRTCRYSSRRRC